MLEEEKEEKVHNLEKKGDDSHKTTPPPSTNVSQRMPGAYVWPKETEETKNIKDGRAALDIAVTRARIQPISPGKTIAGVIRQEAFTDNEYTPTLITTAIQDEYQEFLKNRNYIITELNRDEAERFPESLPPDERNPKLKTFDPNERVDIGASSPTTLTGMVAKNLAGASNITLEKIRQNLIQRNAALDLKTKAADYIQLNNLTPKTTPRGMFATPQQTPRGEILATDTNSPRTSGDNKVSTLVAERKRSNSQTPN